MAHAVARSGGGKGGPRYRRLDICPATLAPCDHCDREAFWEIPRAPSLMRDGDGDMLCEGKRSPPRFYFGLEEMPDVAFDWADPLLLEASLREEERLARDSARSFAQ